MRTIKYNQFQSIYILDDKRKVLLDFLYNNIDLYSEDTIFRYEYDEQYNKQSIKLDNILMKKINDLMDVTIITNLDCNMHCVYCYENNASLNIENRQQSVNIDDILDFISSEFRMNPYRGLKVNLLGGEPLLDKNINFLDQFFERIKSTSETVKLSLVTNGINVSKYIKNIISWEIGEIQITLDGTEKVQNERRVVLNKNQNGFEKIQEGINMLLENGIEVFLRVNIDENNVDEIISLARFIIEKDWQNKGLYPYIYPVTSSGNENYVLIKTELDIFKMVLDKLKVEEQQIRSLFKLDFHGIDYIDNLINRNYPNIRTRFCGVSTGQYVISFDGTVLNCWWGLEEDVFRIGKIEEGKYYINNLKVRKFAKRNTLEINRCSVCKFKYLCGAGCAYKENINKGTVDKGNCSEFDKLIREYLNYVL